MPASKSNQLIEWVSEDIIRQYFNLSQLFEQTKSGQLKTELKRSSHPVKPPIGEPFCTRSQILYYYSLKGEPVAVVHQYLRPDGSIGGSGRPDPKRIFLKDKIISVRTKILP